MEHLGIKSRGFTFVEILVVVVIVAVLAALVVPRFGQASADPDLAALSAILQTVRNQLQTYHLQHNGAFPSFADCEKQMLARTRPDGTLSADGSCGPYLLQIPVNPLDGSRKISPILDASGGWRYDQDTGQFSSNDAGVLSPDSPTRDL